MEKEQYQDYWAPYTPAHLVKSSELLERALDPAGGYNSPDKSRRALILLFSKILQTNEKLVGSLLSLKEPIAKWTFIINYFREKNIFENIFFGQLYHDEPKMIRCVTDAMIFHRNFSNLTDGRTPKNGYTHGDSFDLDEAIAKAIGEFLERFSLLIYREKDLTRASLKELKNRGRKLYLGAEDLSVFSDKQKTQNSRFRFDHESNFLWTEAKSLFDNRPYLIPAQLIFWNYVTGHQNWLEPILRESNTNGAGGHYTFIQAALSGLYELIQRDGFLIYWLNSQAPPQIDLETIEYEPLKRFIDECQRLRFEVHFYNTTSDLNVPSCICTVFDHSGIGPKISMGGGCEMDWDKMLLRAVAEAFGVYHWLRQRKDRGEKYLSLDKSYKPFQDDTFEQSNRLSLWGNEKMFDHFQFFLQGEMQSVEELKKKYQKFLSSEEELNYLIEKFKARGKDYEVFCYQANHEILKDLNYFSVKVIVPALVPLYLREVLAPLGAKRLKEVPEKLGFKPAREWNPWPHPFP